MRVRDGAVSGLVEKCRRPHPRDLLGRIFADGDAVGDLPVGGRIERHVGLPHRRGHRPHRFRRLEGERRVKRTVGRREREPRPLRTGAERADQQKQTPEALELERRSVAHGFSPPL